MRIELTRGESVTLRHFEGDKNYLERTFTIGKRLGRGASCIAYYVTYEEKGCYKHSGVLKEFKPEDNSITRETFLEGYKIQSEFRTEYEAAKNITANTEGIYEGNHTIYTLVTCDQGKCYDEIQEESLVDLFKTALALTRAISVYHQNGYLHLDIKPSNLFIFTETREIIKLFDFDSVHKIEEIEEITLSFTEKWAAPELSQIQKRHKIGKATDIYAIGALIFEKIIGYTPRADERKKFASYTFDPNNKLFEGISPKCKKVLKDLFRKTLQVQVENRYQSTTELEEILLLLLEIVDIKTPFLNDRRWAPASEALGRESELEEIHQRLKEENTVFIQAMVGTGKSELAKMYAKKYEKYYHTIQFVQFQTNLKETILSSLSFSNLNEKEYEKGNLEEEDLLKIKLNLLNQLDQYTLIVIDNFDVSYDEQLDNLLTNKPEGYKMIFTTRNINESYSQKYFYLKCFKKEQCLKLYYVYFGEGIKYRAKKDTDLEKIFEKVGYNTYLIRMIALNCKGKRLEPKEISKELDQSSISTVKDKIEQEAEFADEEISSEEIEAYLSILLNMTGLKKKKNLYL